MDTTSNNTTNTTHCAHVQYPHRMRCNRAGCPNHAELPDAIVAFSWIESHYRHLLPRADLSRIAWVMVNGDYYLEFARRYLPRRLYVVVQQAVAVLSA